MCEWLNVDIYVCVCVCVCVCVKTCCFAEDTTARMNYYAETQPALPEEEEVVDV